MNVELPLTLKPANSRMEDFGRLNPVETEGRIVLVLQAGLHRLSAMWACVMSGLAKPGVLVESEYISGGASLVDDRERFPA